MSDHGKEAEDFVERVCRAMFLGDFTIRGQAFEKGSGVTKEAADVLVPFVVTLIAFQVKSKRGPADPGQRDDTYLRRVDKVISEGIDQLKTIKRALRAKHLRQLRNAQGITLPFDPTRITELVGIVVIDLPDDTYSTAEARISILNGFQYRHDIPVHLFRSDEFSILAQELDTIPDFLDYLRKREHCFRKNKVTTFPSELDFLAFYKLRPDELERAVSEENHYIFLDEGIWDSYQTDHAADIRRRDAANESSYLIDRVIAWLHTSIGFDMPDTPVSYEKPATPPSGTPEELENYKRSALELARLPRLARRAAASKWIEKMIQADNRGMGYSLIQNPHNKEALLVMASDASRETRRNVLMNVASVAYCWRELRKLVGIITEPASAKLRSYDILILHDVEFENADELRARASEIFGALQNRTTTEFGQS